VGEAEAGGKPLVGVQRVRIPHALRWSVKVFSEGSWCPARGSTHTGRPAERSPLLSKSRAAHIPAPCGPRVIARRSFMKRRMSDQTSCGRLAGLPTAGQRHGRERRPAVRPWTTRDITSIAGKPTDPESNFVAVDRNGLPRKPEVPDEWRTALAQRVEVSGLVVRGFGSASHRYKIRIHLKRQCPNGSLMRTALRSLLPVVSGRPRTIC